MVYVTEELTIMGLHTEKCALHSAPQEKVSLRNGLLSLCWFLEFHQIAVRDHFRTQPLERDRSIVRTIKRKKNIVYSY